MDVNKVVKNRLLLEVINCIVLKKAVKWLHKNTHILIIIFYLKEFR